MVKVLYVTRSSVESFLIIILIIFLSNLVSYSIVFLIRVMHLYAHLLIGA